MNTATGSDDPRDYLVDQGFANYTDADHETWRTLARRQTEDDPAGPDRRSVSRWARPARHRRGRHSGFWDMNRKLRAATGWEVVAVPGLIPDLAFFRLLADRKFPAGFWIRKPSQIDYIEEPDIFHDVFGHVPLIMQPIYADYLECLRQGRSCRGRARGLEAPRAPLLVHGRVRPRADAGGIAHRRRRHRVLAIRDDVRS